MVSKPAIQDYAYMKLGQLIHSYQKFEILLKNIVARSNISGKKDELEENLRKLHVATSSQTLGSITNRLFDTLYAPSEDVSEPENMDQPFFFSELRIMIDDPEVLEKTRKKFKRVVEDRNMLIHSTLATIDFKSEDSCNTLIDEIDRQREQLTPLYNDLINTLRLSDDFVQALAANPELFDYQAEMPNTIQIGGITYTKQSH